MRPRCKARKRPAGSGVLAKFRFLRYSDRDTEQLQLTPCIPERACAAPKVSPWINHSIEPFAYVSKSYAIRPQCFGAHLFPEERNRQWSVGSRSHRIRRRHGLSVSIAIDIEEHAPMSRASASPYGALLQSVAKRCRPAAWCSRLRARLL